jgi:hypothetical protein
LGAGAPTIAGIQQSVTNEECYRGAAALASGHNLVKQIMFVCTDCSKKHYIFDKLKQQLRAAGGAAARSWVERRLAK